MRKLLIGQASKAEGWEILNIYPGPFIDHVGNANDLSRFADATFSTLYASHVIEHFDYIEELPKVLIEWLRVLTPGGSLYVSAPDLEALAKLFIDKQNLSASERYYVMRMMFGGHTNKHDYHVVGLDQDILGKFLFDAGFVNLRRVNQFGIFKDTSEIVYKGVLVSVNIIAEKNA